ncbi:hypothetical protein RR48_06980 [Papilio machaon]|uniref:Uncharacterized protein n=1 Tax=Papilio machaon TaxID=76193 RepID=A0A194RAC8_PAPMA|nr:hypothetical protein RR48_06980 [Papilio machaon]
MATPGSKKSSKDWDKVSVNSAVQWCCYVLLLALCGYSLYRQHGLERRLHLLEQQHGGLRRLVAALQPPALRRRRDLTDCICPQDRDRAHKSAFIQFSTAIIEVAVDVGVSACEGKAVDLGRILKMNL